VEPSVNPIIRGSDSEVGRRGWGKREGEGREGRKEWGEGGDNQIHFGRQSFLMLMFCTV
jgi:hypothetical protein